jgi:hypothetical protein
MVTNELDCLKFEFLREREWIKGQAVSNFLTHSPPLQQKWMQTILGKSRGKISLFLIFGLCTQKMPMSNWACFRVLLATALQYFFWHWTGDGFAPPLGVVVLCLFPAELQSVGLHWWVGLVPELLAWEGASGLNLLQELVLFQGFKV